MRTVFLASFLFGVISNMAMCKQKFVSLVVGLAIAVVVASPGTGQAGDCPKADVEHFKTELLQLRSEYMALANATKNEPMRGNEIIVLREIDMAIDQVDSVLSIMELIEKYCEVDAMDNNKEIWSAAVGSADGMFKTVHDCDKTSVYILSKALISKNRFASVVKELMYVINLFDGAVPWKI